MVEKRIAIYLNIFEYVENDEFFEYVLVCENIFASFVLRTQMVQSL